MVDLCLEYGAIIRQPKVSDNRFYSCVLVALAIEWKRGWRLHANADVFPTVASAARSDSRKYVSVRRIGW